MYVYSYIYIYIYIVITCSEAAMNRFKDCGVAPPPPPAFQERVRVSAVHYTLYV